MALRSGYKGFKKLLGLKTIRPGTLAVDDAALANMFFPRSEQAIVGAHNILSDCVESYELQSTSVSPFLGHLYIDKTMNVKTSWKQSKAIDSATRNTFVLRSVTDHSVLYYSTNYATPLLNAGLHEEIIQNVPAGYYELGLWVADASDTFSISEIMVRLATDTDSNYSKPSKTNIQLTKELFDNSLLTFTEAAEHTNVSNVNVRAVKIGNIKIVTVHAKVDAILPDYVVVGTVDGLDMDSYLIYPSNNDIPRVRIDADGKVKVYAISSGVVMDFTVII